MKFILCVIVILSLCRVSQSEELEYSTWTDAILASRKDGLPVLALMGSESCQPCQTMKQQILPALYRKGLLATVHVCMIDVDRSRQLFDSLKQGTAIPQLLITDLKDSRVHVGAMSEQATYKWLTGK